MTEHEWARLREQLVAQFDEDTVQQVLLDLLEVQARGTVVLNPLHWCRRSIARRLKNARRNEFVEREAKQELQGLGIPLDTRSRRTVKAGTMRRLRKRKRAA